MKLISEFKMRPCKRSPQFGSTDERWMKRALALAEKGRGFASPNPVVGACVVKSGKLVSEGFHETFGGPHAEVNALCRAGKKARGSTLYVTLEPCSTWQKTPPCTRSIIESGVKRVVVTALDPNPKHAGRGIRILKKAGIRVDIGVFKREAEEQNKYFSRWVLSGKPFVILKMAQSLDGKIATRTGESRWMTDKESRKFVHELRSKVDAIVVGKNTVLKDDPELTVRLKNARWQPWKFVLDTRGELSPGHRIFKASAGAVLVCLEKVLKKVLRRFKNASVSILPIPERKGRLDLRVLVKKLGTHGFTSLLVEGGGELAAGFLDDGLVDHAYFMIAPKIIGGRNAKTSVEGEGIRKLADACGLDKLKVYKLGEDIIIEGSPHVYGNH